MAFRRKDVKKASYYVWFLGAKESKGLRGDEYVVPVLRFLLDKERQFEPSKVTLQVSNKGLKIVQTLNVPRKSGNALSSKLTTISSSVLPKTEQIKHMIPHHSVTCVSQEEDIICCIMLIYNPITKCPVHVHAYRCDSIETATTLRNQLQILIDRPENQKKFREIEMRLAAKGLMPTHGPVPPGIGIEFTSPNRRTLNSDGRSTRTEGSDNTDESIGSSDLGYNGSKESKNGIVTNGNKNQPETKGPISTLYESLAAELRAKLGNPKSGPILLPPRDYDTISRKRGKLEGIELRKSTNTQIVGPLEHTVSPVTRSESSGKSSGIGSDEALSSAIQEIHPDYDHESASSSDDDEWILERHRRSSPNHRPEPIKKVMSNAQPIAPKYGKRWSDKNYERDNSSPPLTNRRHHQPQPPSRVKSQYIKPQHPQKYYFPDPAFSVPEPQTLRTRSRSEQKLQRRQSNPDFFRSVSPVVMRSGALSPIRHSHDHNHQMHNRVDDHAPQYRNRMSPDHYYGREMSTASKDTYQFHRETPQPRSVTAHNRHSFIETPLRRISALHY